MAEEIVADVEMNVVEAEVPAEEMAEEKVEEKVEEDAVAGEPAKPKEPEKPKELEEDGIAETRVKVSAGFVEFNSADSTMNVLTSNGCQIISSLTGGGFSYLLGGARTTVGLTSGRYMFEVKILELHSRQEPQGAAGRIPMPRHIVKLGLSQGDTSLLMGDNSEGSVSIDSEGFLQHEKTRKKVAKQFRANSVVAFLVNLDAASPNANTISVFCDGVRICAPQAIPDNLLGKPLFPTVTFKAVTMQVNYGPVSMAPLPFKCNMLSDAAQADVQVGPKASEGPCEIVMPVGLPEQGYFDWVDAFLEKNPGYTELSDRKILDWAHRSGIFKAKTPGAFSTDKPDMKFGIPLMDDMSVKKLLLHIAPTVRKSFVVTELKANLTADERKAFLKNFAGPSFKKVAKVVVGEPTADYKAKVQQLMIEEKKEKTLAERKKKAAEAVRTRLLEERKKKVASMKQKKEAEVEGAEEKEVAPEEVVDEDVVVELTDEEKALHYRKNAQPDILDQTLSKCFMDFSLPTTEEGFDQVTFEWASQDTAEKVVKDWIFSKKMAQRVENVQPGQWFKDAWTEWAKTVAGWKRLQAEWKDPNKKKALLAKKAEAKKKEAEEKGEEAPKEEAPMEINADDLQVSSVENVADIGSGEPLFADFTYEDWALLSARYELHLLLHSFKKDVEDPDRQSFTEKDLGFYYQKYVKKNWALRSFAVDTMEKFIDLVKDTVRLAPQTAFLEPLQGEEMTPSAFVKLAEEHRRERTRRADAGDESAELKFPRAAGIAAAGGVVAPGSVGRMAPQQPLRAPYGAPNGGGTRPAGYAGVVPGAGAGGFKRPAPPTNAPTSYVAKRPTFGGAWKS